MPEANKCYSNVLGAFNTIAMTMVCVSNTSYINSASVCDLLWDIALLHPGRKFKIVLDNTAYQRCNLVQEFAKELGFDLIFLPGYSDRNRQLFAHGSHAPRWAVEHRITSVTYS